MSVDHDRLWRMFTPEAARQITRVRDAGTRFAHYTSAASGIEILRSGRVLLRNSALMNDFSEVQHGMNCLFECYNGKLGEKLKEILRKVQADLPDILEKNFNAQLMDCRAETYLVSISEHGDPVHGDELEDTYGRLSMWRAYAGKNGVAFVFKNTPFVTDTNALNAFTSPVVYASTKSFCVHFEELVSNLEGQIDLLTTLGGQFLHDNLMNVFTFTTQSTKHPAFREEREWRVIYSPTLRIRDEGSLKQQMDRVPTDIMTINGVPQRVYGIPFKNYPDDGFVGATIPELIDRVLIGPSLDAYAISQAYIAELSQMGVQDARARVFITGIPLRT